MEWIDGILGWFGFSIAGIGALGGIAWFFGFAPVLGAFAQVLAAVLAPVAGAVTQGVVWVWQNVLWPGIWHFLSDIFDSWVTVLGFAATLAILVGIYESRLAWVERRERACIADLSKRRLPPPRVEEPEPAWEPFGWLLR